MVSQPTSEAISVFVNASVLFTAAHSATGAGRELILSGLRGQIKVFVSTYVLKEVERNLTASAPRALPQFRTLSEALSTMIVDPPTSVVLEISRKVEPKDAPIVAAAVEAKADYIATYDRNHLLSQSSLIRLEYGIGVVEPGEVLRLLREG